jgi:hypothetical protein
MDIVDRLLYEAQNNQMIDQHFTELGHLLEEAAVELRRLRVKEDKFIDSLCQIEQEVKNALSYMT